MWHRLLDWDRKNKELQQNFKPTDIKNKYVRWVMYVIMLKFIWDITTVFEKYLPMEKIYRFIGFWIFWALWFIMVLTILFNLVGAENFHALLNDMA